MKQILLLIIVVILTAGCQVLPKNESSKRGAVVRQETKNYRYSIYLPKSYNTTDKRYAVIYFSNMNNVMEEYGWNMAGILDQMIDAEQIDQCIAVVFEPKANEYSEQEVVKEIVPYIDSNYRTLASRENRAIFGGSFGGGFAIKTTCTYPEIFSYAGAFSFHPFIGNIEFIKAEPKKNVTIWISEGTRENGSDNYLKFGRQAVSLFIDKGYEYGKDLFYYEDIGGVHGGGSWAKVFRYSIVMFNGKGKKNIKSLMPLPEYLNGPSRSVYINPILELENGGRYMALNAEYNIINKKDAEIDTAGFVKFGSQEKIDVSVSAAGLKSDISFGYSELLKKSSLQDLRIYSKAIENKTVNLSGVDLRYFNGIHYINVNDFIKMVNYFKKITPEYINEKYNKYIVYENSEKYIPAVFFSNETEFRQILYKTNVIFAADKEILYKMLKTDRFNDIIGINVEVSTQELKQFTFEYMLNLIKEKKNMDISLVENIKARYLEKLIKTKNWFEYYEILNNAVNEISADIYILKYGNPFETKDVIYNTLKIENENIFFLINKQQVKKIGTVDFSKVKPDKENIKSAIEKMIVISKEDEEQNGISVVCAKDKIYGGMTEFLGCIGKEENLFILPDNSILVM